MAFLKQAKAVVVHPRISGRGWGGVCKVATSGSERSLTDQARDILGGALDPDKYLITHCTIVASVDVEDVPGVKLGHVKVGSKTINRKYGDYYIKPSCSQFVNNNGDSWSRPVLRKAYQTFVGAHNFQEHVQIEEQSKGRVIDAAARDIGDSLYVDILVATDRKHASLVQDIESGKLATLSMGCTTDFTVCTKCGHYAVDETDLCDHIRYQKLNTFMDNQGQKRVIAELCGHEDYDETGGVHFIEASWVAIPAFPGAVMRNVLSPGEVSEEDVRKVLASPPTAWSEEAVLKAASHPLKAFDFGGGDDEGEGEDAPAKAAPAAPFQDIEDALYTKLKARVKERIEREIAQEAIEQAVDDSVAPMDANDSIIKEGAQRYRHSLQTLVRVASSHTALVEGIAQTNAAYGIEIPVDVYRAALDVGPYSRYQNSDHYRLACRRAAKRKFTPAEIRVVVRVGSLLSHWESNNNPISPTTPEE